MGKLREYMTIKEAAAYLGVAPNTLRNWGAILQSAEGKDLVEAMCLEPAFCDVCLSVLRNKIVCFGTYQAVASRNKIDANGLLERLYVDTNTSWF